MIECSIEVGKRKGLKMDVNNSNVDNAVGTVGRICLVQIDNLKHLMHIKEINILWNELVSE